MGRFINAGYENNVNIDKIIAILNSDSAPGRRLIRNPKKHRSISLKKNRVGSDSLRMFVMRNPVFTLIFLM